MGGRPKAGRPPKQSKIKILFCTNRVDSKIKKLFCTNSKAKIKKICKKTKWLEGVGGGGGQRLEGPPSKANKKIVLHNK